MKTYPEMNAKIVGLLKMKDDPVSLYAAARIEELETDIQYKAEALWEAESEVKRIGRQIAKLTADLHERDLAMANEMEATRSAELDAEMMEKALEEACVLITNHVNVYGTGMDLPMDLLANSRKPEAWKWKKYFMQEADQ